MSFMFNGIRKSWVTATKVRRPYQTNQVLNILHVPGMPGGHLVNVDEYPLVIPAKIEINGDDREDYFNKAEELVAWLSVKDPSPLIFDDRPNRTYFAVIEGSLIPEEIVSIGYVDVLFVCPDPYKYGPELSAQFPSGTVTLTNNGTAKAKPIFEFEVLKPITFAMIQNQNNEYMMIGEIPTIDNTPFEREQLINRYTMSNLTGWTESTEIEGGAVAGHILTDGDTFRPGSYGTGANWHGPPLKTSLSEALRDFKVDAYVTLKAKTAPEIGRLEISLLGAGNQVVGKLALKEMRKGTNSTIGEVRIGSITNGHYLINTPGVRDGVWNDFYGILRLQRIGTQIRAYIAKIDGGNHNTIWESEPFEDTEGVFQEPITQVQVHFGQNGTNTFVSDIGVHEIRVFKINDPNANQIPIIADVGDSITFDHVVENILINGESRTDLLNFGAGYFKLVPGENQLVVLPEGAFGNKSVKWRPPYR